MVIELIVEVVFLGNFVFIILVFVVLIMLLLVVLEVNIVWEWEKLIWDVVKFSVMVVDYEVYFQVYLEGIFVNFVWNGIKCL